MTRFSICLLLSIVLFRCASLPVRRDTRYLDAAREVAKWLRSTEVETPHGRVWPDDALRPVDISADISTGVAGKVLFFLMLHQADPSAGSIADARRGADYLLATLPETLGSDQFPPPASLYYGIAGVGFTLHEMYAATRDRRYLDGALTCVRLLDGRDEWSPFNDVLFGSSGTGLFLLYAAREMDDRAAAALAERAAIRLVAEGVADRGGLKWFLRDGRQTDLPNFSHGTAGVAYFLASVAHQTGKREFLDKALLGAAYLDAIANTTAGAYVVPYGYPNPEWANYYEIGWAHGSAGTARLFERLGQITTEAGWRSKLAAASRVLEISGAPGTPREGFGSEPFKLDMRFGVASFAEFLLNIGEVSRGRPLVDFVLMSGQRDAGGLRWPMKRYAFMTYPGTDAIFTGYHYGAAGYGVLSLRAHAALSGTPATLRLPDDPFR